MLQDTWYTSPQKIQNEKKKEKEKKEYLADQGPLAHLPWEIATLSSSYELTSTILLHI